MLEKVRQIPGRGLITEPQYHTVILSNGTAAPADITSLIVSRPDIHQLLNAKPFLLSYFMPQVRLYKVFGNPRGDGDREEDETPEERLQRRKNTAAKIGLMVCVWGVHVGSVIASGGPHGLLCGSTTQRLIIALNVAFQTAFTLGFA